MGLNTTHGAWDGPYSSFHEWRRKIAELIDVPLDNMEGFTENVARLKWKNLKPNPLHALLNHSDCDGNIPYRKCKGIAEELEKLLPRLQSYEYRYYLDKTIKFIDGCKLAYNRKEKIEFH